MGEKRVAMLREMHIRNCLLFRDTDISFDSGFSAITGETGAGKSMFVSLLRVLFGELKAKEVLGPFDNTFSIETLWDNQEDLVAIYRQNDLPEEDMLLLKVTGTEDRLTFRVNGSMVSASIMKEIVSSLMAIHSQNAFQNLRNPLFHTVLVDSNNKASCEAITTEYRTFYKEYLDLKRLYKLLPSDTREMYRTNDFIGFQIQEIENANLVIDEEERVNSELKILSNFEFLKQALSSALQEIEGSEETMSLIDRLGEASNRLRKAEDIEKAVVGWREAITTIMDILQSTTRDILSYLDAMDYDEERLREVGARYDLIEALKKKYGNSIGEILDRLRNLREEKEEIQKKLYEAEHIDERIERIKKRLEQLDTNWKTVRENVSEDIEKKVTTELRHLKMERTRFSHDVRIEDDFTAHGRHFIEWTASINPGMPFLPIAKIASGGELSRIFLALELALKETLSARTLLFDEIDSGVGPRMGHIVGDKIKQLSESGFQVFVITHLPQVAIKADHHYLIKKDAQEEQSFSQVVLLEGTKREKELQDMAGNLESGINERP
jgi:DNA repair protein RecN (Recombination protein N)